MDGATRATLMRRFGYIFEGEGMYPPIATPRDIPPHGNAWSVDGPSGSIPILTFDQDHGGVRSVGYRIGGLAYSSDVVALPESATSALSGLDIWVVDALRMTPHPTHAHLALTLKWVEHYRPKRAILTNMHIDMDFATLQRTLPSGVEAGYDGNARHTRGSRRRPRMKLGFLASNSGSSLRAIVAAIESGALTAEARLVISNKRAASALTFARAHGIPTRFIPTLRSQDNADSELTAALKEADVDLVILSGYLRKLGPRTLGAYRNRILNIHPALLPRHGGAGMYGRRVHEAALAAGDKVSGASIHLVDEEYDHGQVLARAEVPVLRGDSAADLEARVMAAEPTLFVQTLQHLADGVLQLPKLS